MASAATVPKVSGFNEFSRTKPILLVEEAKKMFMDVVKVPTVHKNLGADWRLDKVLGELRPPKPPWKHHPYPHEAIPTNTSDEYFK